MVAKACLLDQLFLLLLPLMLLALMHLQFLLFKKVIYFN